MIGPGRSALQTRPELATTSARGLLLTFDWAGTLLFMAVGFIRGSQAIGDNSFLTHLATGRLIVEQGSVPSADPYSYTAHGEPWVVQSWLISIVYAQLEDVFGLAGIRVFHGLLVAAIFAGIWRLSRPVDSLVPRFLICGMAVAAMYPAAGPRPLLVGLLGVVAVRGAQARWFRPWWLVPIMAIWVNSHGSFPLALGILGLSGLVLLVQEGRIDPLTLRLGVAALVGTFIGAALSPVGFKLLAFPVHLMGRREALDGVSEWAPWQLQGWIGWSFAAVLALLAVSMARKAPLMFTLPAAVLAITALMAVRNIPAAVVLIVGAAALARSLEVGSLRSDGRGPVALGVAAVAAVIGLVAVIQLDEPSWNLSRFPVSEVSWLDERDLVAVADVNLLTDETTGNYLDLRFGDDARVFFDDRFDFFPLGLQEEFRSLGRVGPYDEPLERWDVDVVLWPTDSGLIRWLEREQGWVVVDLDDEVDPDGDVPPVSEAHSVACRAALAARCTP